MNLYLDFDLSLELSISIQSIEGKTIHRTDFQVRPDRDTYTNKTKPISIRTADARINYTARTTFNGFLKDAVLRRGW